VSYQNKKKQLISIGIKKYILEYNSKPGRLSAIPKPENLNIKSIKYLHKGLKIDIVLHFSRNRLKYPCIIVLTE
jgi:hypothetical protein